MASAQQPIVDEYNQLTGKSVKRFATLEAAQRALAKAKGEPVPAKEKKEAAHKESSAAVKKSWKDKGTRDARIKRTAVAVAGHGKFKSVMTAFQSLKLPLNKVISFRLELKEKGHATIDGKKFTIAEMDKK